VPRLSSQNHAGRATASARPFRSRLLFGEPVRRQQAQRRRPPGLGGGGARVVDEVVGYAGVVLFLDITSSADEKGVAVDSEDVDGASRALDAARQVDAYGRERRRRREAEGDADVVAGGGAGGRQRHGVDGGEGVRVHLFAVVLKQHPPRVRDGGCRRARGRRRRRLGFHRMMMGSCCDHRRLAEPRYALNIYAE